MSRRFRAAALTIALAMAAGPAMAADDGFAAFWKSFTAALARDDQVALAKMVVLGPGLDEATPLPLTFEKFHADYLDAKARPCLAKAKPLRDVDAQGRANYSAFCGGAVFVFCQRAGAWKLTDVGADD